MNTLSRFLIKFASLIVCTLHCFDRVIFKGHLAVVGSPRTRILRRLRSEGSP